MARKVEVRENYLNDSIKLRRLRDAVQKDVRRPVAWRESVVEHLDEALKLLLTAPDIAA